MKTYRNFSGILAALLALVASMQHASAGDINGPAMAGLVLNNTIPDGDLYALSLFAGRSGNVLSTSATDTTAGFTETLSGNYAGQALSVAYTGNTTAFPAGAVTWSSTGTYGAQAWAGSGSATFTFPTASTFQVAYTESLTIGANSVAINATLYGADNGTRLYYTGVSGTLTVNANPPIPAPMYTEGVLLVPIIGSIGYDDYEVDGQVTITQPL